MKNVMIAAFFLSVATATQAQTVGNDTDAHGCKASAGYTYSTVLKECIRIFEQEMKLESVNNPGSPNSIGAIIFSKDKKKAEVFIAEAKPSIVLSRKGKEGSYIWKNGEYSISQSGVYALKKGDTEIYKRN